MFKVLPIGKVPVGVEFARLETDVKWVEFARLETDVKWEWETAKKINVHPQYSKPWEKVKTIPILGDNNCVYGLEENFMVIVNTEEDEWRG